MDEEDEEGDDTSIENIDYEDESHSLLQTGTSDINEQKEVNKEFDSKIKSKKSDYSNYNNVNQSNSSKEFQNDNESYLE